MWGGVEVAKVWGVGCRERKGERKWVGERESEIEKEEKREGLRFR